MIDTLFGALLISIFSIGLAVIITEIEDRVKK